jgi:anti-sigma B factor antagonist
MIETPGSESSAFAALAPFRCDVFHAPDRAIVAIHGEVDVFTAPTVSREVRAALALPIAAVRIDLRHVTFLDSSGVHVLVATRRMAAELGIPYSLTSVPPQVRRVLHVTGLAATFGLETDPDEDGHEHGATLAG